MPIRSLQRSPSGLRLTRDPRDSGLTTLDALKPIPTNHRQFPCTQCGGRLEFAPGIDALKCPYCGHENQIAAKQTEVLELDFEAFVEKLRAAPALAETTIQKCNACGAQTTLDANTAAGACPFCATPFVRTSETRRLIKPGSLLPFKVTRDTAQASFRSWLASLWFAPGDLKRMAERDTGINGVYLPYWTYDADTTSAYVGERGDDYWVTETYTVIVNGKAQTRTRQVRRTRWSNVSGTVRDDFDDILVLASHSLPQKYVKELEPWDLPSLVGYDDAYLAGFRAEMYQVDLVQGFDAARQIMQPTIHESIRRDIGGDHQRIHNVNIRYSAVTFKHLLLPVWVSAYRYRARVYRFVVNARTGEVQGERPYSAWKIASAVIAGLVVVALIVFVLSRYAQ